ncbi:hypothetical protein PsYK624_082550 [Phanerochaete sordida]|uniref:Uncharacterized protein n=1 Tax=Phanerochaete sordida TaxID=48140 RepID=A0A9P3GCJ3_9APHY|nr:hypothetical protein PsYK624_082550 [Phanerochaete sordida]
MAASLPSLSSRQSTPAICTQAGKAPYNRGLLQVWDDAHATLYGYLSPEPVPALVGSPYGWVTQNPANALQGVYTCGGPPQGSGGWLLGASNARTVPGASADAIGLFASAPADNFSPNLSPVNNASFVTFMPAYVTAPEAIPNSGDIGAGVEGWYESAVWGTAPGPDASGTMRYWFTPGWVDKDFGQSTVWLELAACLGQGLLVGTGDFATFTSVHDYWCAQPWVKVKLAASVYP